MTLTETPK